MPFTRLEVDPFVPHRTLDRARVLYILAHQRVTRRGENLALKAGASKKFYELLDPQNGIPSGGIVSLSSGAGVGEFSPTPRDPCSISGAGSGAGASS